MRPHAPADRALSRYAREIERRFGERIERPLVLSPRDWARIADWHERGIPLALVLESIDAAFEARKRGRPGPRSLTYVAPLVEESWRTILDGRRRPDRVGPRGEFVPSPVAAWCRRRDTEPRGSNMHRLLDRLLRQLDSGAAPSTVDAELDSGLAEGGPDDLSAPADRAADLAVARLRGRVPEDALTRARRVARVAWLRRRLGLPRLVS